MVNNLTFCVFFWYTLYKIYFWCSRCPMNVSSWSKAFFLRRISSQESRVMPGRLWRPSESFVEAVILHFISFPHGLIHHIIYAEIMVLFLEGGLRLLVRKSYACWGGIASPQAFARAPWCAAPEGWTGFFSVEKRQLGQADWEPQYVRNSDLAEMWIYHLDKLAVFGRKSLHLWSWCCVAWVQASKPYLGKHVFHGCEW